jgi:glutamine amidotransferase
VVIIVDYGMGNLGSIANMLKKIGVRARISSSLSEIESADKLILPGVGAFDTGMARLTELGFVDALNDKVLHDKTPILGLCVGMQLFAQRSEEGKLPGLGWLDAEVVRFKFGPEQRGLKIPHMGWNYIRIHMSSQLFIEMPQEARFYFVHSYHLVCQDERDVLATTVYGYEFPSIIMSRNIMGAQFHPEKSHKFGMRLLKNFVEYF